MPEGMPSAKEIDELAAKYDAMKATLDTYKTDADQVREQLLTMVQKWGSCPPGATKSKRIEGDVWEVTASAGQTVEVKQSVVTRIFTILKDAGLHLTFFNKLFKKEETYRLRPGAQELMASPLPKLAPRNLRQLFADAVQIKEKAPSLKVERRKKGEAA